MEHFNQIAIKGMVCARCIRAIQTGLQNLGFPVRSISLGKVIFEQPIDASALPEVEQFLQEIGFEVLKDRNTQLLDQIKTIVAEYIEYDLDDLERLKLSTLLPARLHLSYDTLSTFFSDSEGITLEKYVIKKRLEKVNQLLIESTRSLTEIAYLTGYSSVHHLSKQFKTHYGFVPSSLRMSAVGPG